MSRIVTIKLPVHFFVIFCSQNLLLMYAAYQDIAYTQLTERLYQIKQTFILH